MNITTEAQLRSALDTMRADTILARAITAEMDAAIAAVHAKFDHKIKERTDSVKALGKAVEVYASTHRKELLPKGVKSAMIERHEIGWRDNGGAIVCRKGLTEKKVLTRLLKAGGALRNLFVRQTPSLNKEAMKDKWRMFGSKLTAMGLRLKHEEDFYINLDVSEEAAA